MRKITLGIFALFLFTFTKTYSQCNLEETITICDMTLIDNNSDGIPDGIINLYDEYTNLTGNTIQAGTWFDPGFNFALNESTGDVSLWDLDNSSEAITDYQFQLTNADCGADIALTLNIVIGPFSGIAVPTIGDNEVNVEVCDVGVDPCGSSSFFDLNQALLSVPSAHANGTWSYEGSSPNFLAIQDNTYLLVDVPYQPGLPLVDQETFELKYTVPGIAPCAPNMVTMVKVSVIREVFAGAANSINICETELVAGDFDNVDLTNDSYLVNEDIEGIWLFEDDTTGQISNPGDSNINLGEVFDELFLVNPRFGCQSYQYSYFVESRSPVCQDKTSTVSFTFFEDLRPFSQVEPPPEFCCLTELGNLNLYDLLTFTTENGVLYDYPNDNCTNWTLVSGPSNLGLVSNTGSICSTFEDPLYTSQGSINLDNISNADAGTYVFEYTVLPEYNCGGQGIQPENIFSTPDGCTSNTGGLSPCDLETAQVTIIILPVNYAGEDTALEFCESEISSPVDLFSLLGTNGDPIYMGPLGTWTDLNTGNTITNMFSVPEVSDQETFNFLYSTTSPNDCSDDANLSFTVYEQFQAGTGGTIQVCDDGSPINLFEVLTDDPVTTGTWEGPNGFTSTSNSVMFDPSTFEPGNYIYSIPDNGPCLGNQATVSVTILQNLSAGNDVLETICRSDMQVDLINLLDGADTGGTFLDLDATNTLSGSLVNVSQLSAGTYNFEYQIQVSPICSLDSSLIELTIIEGPAPTAVNQTFCLTDLATVGDLEASNSMSYMWYDTNSSTDVLASNTLLENGEDYYVSGIDSNGCETMRAMIQVTLLPITHDDCDCIINDGISDNDDNENENLDLCNLPEVFPNYELEVFNRYGTIVFKGDNNTGLFEGESNVSPTIGDMLPSGIYFYVFNPNDGESAPFQGNVYLSR